jgi:hypothetical protein
VKFKAWPAVREEMKRRGASELAIKCMRKEYARWGRHMSRKARILRGENVRTLPEEHCSSSGVVFEVQPQHNAPR